MFQVIVLDLAPCFFGSFQKRYGWYHIFQVLLFSNLLGSLFTNIFTGVFSQDNNALTELQCSQRKIMFSFVLAWATFSFAQCQNDWRTRGGLSYSTVFGLVHPPCIIPEFTAPRFLPRDLRKVLKPRVLRSNIWESKIQDLKVLLFLILYHHWIEQTHNFIYYHSR